MTEKLLQFIWQHRYYQTAELRSAEGETIVVFDPGQLNRNQGPDFLQAKILLDGIMLAGSIEIHNRSSEWIDHGHSSDTNYNNVILHVVNEEDKKLGLPFATLALAGRIPRMLLSTYDELMQSRSFIACANSIATTNYVILENWKTRLLAERLESKARRFMLLLSENNNDWEQAFWILLARNFGSPVNEDAFESMARGLPIRLLAKHRASVIQLEALLMGVVGLLEGDFTDAYAIMLQKEFRFLRRKYNLKFAETPMHFLRMRPANFPTLRLSQLAAIIHESNHLLSKIREQSELREIINCFSATANDYWHYRYCFDEAAPFKQKKIRRQMAENIIVNTVLPILHAAGMASQDPGITDRALHFAAMLPPEKNHITKGFEHAGVSNSSAADSQALIELKKSYCDKKRCLECAVGAAFLKL